MKTAMISAVTLLLASVAAPSSMATSAPIDKLTRTSVQSTFEACMLNAGCRWASPSDTEPGYWDCPNPRLTMNCYEPADPIVP